MTCSLLFSLIFAMLFVSTLGLGSVVEYSYTTRDCSGQGDVAHKWPLNKCIGIGNQPPFTESETATIATDNIVTFNYFVGMSFITATKHKTGNWLP